MDDILGPAIAHVGCHPLFGPLSIARAEPLRTVVCPSPLHPETARMARAFFDSIGSEVTEQDPASHDRFMALTHAMAFFIARGLLDLGDRRPCVKYASTSTNWIASYWPCCSVVVS